MKVSCFKKFHWKIILAIRLHNLNCNYVHPVFIIVITSKQIDIQGALKFLDFQFLRI